MNTNQKNGLITFGIVVILINVGLLIFFAIKYKDVQQVLPETVLTPTSIPVSSGI